MKKNFDNVQIELISFEMTDIITTSAGDEAFPGLPEIF